MENLFKNNEEFENETIGKIVEGELPAWLNGTLLRNGPARWQIDDDFCLNHFLDGSAMMVKFDFNSKDNEVRAKNRFLRSDAYQKICQQKRPVFTEFGTQAFSDSSKSLLSRVFNKIIPSDLTDNDISNVYRMNDEVYLTTESCNIWKVDPHNLESLMKINLEKKAGIAISCAHPIYSEDDKCLYNVGSTFLTGMKYHVMKVPLDDKMDNQKTLFDNSKSICTINSSYKASLAFNHSFAITKNYIILIEQSLLVNGLKLATCTPKGKALNECLEWCPDQPAHFHVIDKRTNQLIKHKFESKGFFFFHTINAFEDGEQIVLDILNYDDYGLLETLKMCNLKAGKFDTTSKSKPTRYVLPIGNLKEMKQNENLVTLENCQSTAILNNKGIIELEGQQLGPGGFELPTINRDYIGKPYNYIYCSGFLEKDVLYENAIGKLDIKNNDVKLYKHSTTTYPGEGVFVKSPDANDEDDGVILTLSLETDLNKNSFLSVLDAKTFKLLARIEFERSEISIPTTLHGIWIPKENSDVHFV